MALVVSLVACLATGAQAIYAGYALSEAERNFDLSGPIFDAGATLEFKDASGKVIGADQPWSPDLKHLKKSQLIGATEATFMVTIANRGRAPGALMAFGALLGNDDSYVGVDYKEATTCCIDFVQKEKCPDLPYVIEPGHRITVTKDLLPSLSKIYGVPAFAPPGVEGYPVTLRLSGVREGWTDMGTDTVIDED